jgi:hypothetical protein
MEDYLNNIIQGDCLEVLARLPDAEIKKDGLLLLAYCVTSQQMKGLRQGEYGHSVGWPWRACYKLCRFKKVCSRSPASRIGLHDVHSIRSNSSSPLALFHSSLSR